MAKSQSCKRKEKKGLNGHVTILQKKKEKRPFSISLMRSQDLYQAANSLGSRSMAKSQPCKKKQKKHFSFQRQSNKKPITKLSCKFLGDAVNGQIALLQKKKKNSSAFGVNLIRSRLTKLSCKLLGLALNGQIAILQKNRKDSTKTTEKKRLQLSASIY